MILAAMGTLRDPLQTMDMLLARPEAALDPGLFRQIYDARARFEAEKAAKSSDEQNQESAYSKSGDEKNAEK